MSVIVSICHIKGITVRITQMTEGWTLKLSQVQQCWNLNWRPAISSRSTSSTCRPRAWVAPNVPATSSRGSMQQSNTSHHLSYPEGLLQQMEPQSHGLNKIDGHIRGMAHRLRESYLWGGVSIYIYIYICVIYLSETRKVVVINWKM